MDISKFGLVPHNTASATQGDRFGRLIVLATGKPEGSYRYMAVCQCECGSEPKRIRIDGLTSGNVTGCGCVQKERTTTHGLTGTPFLKRWTHMMARCYDESHQAFHRYGGRGITVCDAWHDARQYAKDIKAGYKEGLQIDRIDNEGNYEPGNVRWVTPSENCDNRSTGRKIAYNGKTQSLTRWAEETGLSISTLSERLSVWGWTVSDALTTPPLSASDRMARARGARRKPR